MEFQLSQVGLNLAPGLKTQRKSSHRKLSNECIVENTKFATFCLKCEIQDKTFTRQKAALLVEQSSRTK